MAVSWPWVRQNAGAVSCCVRGVRAQRKPIALSRPRVAKSSLQPRPRVCQRVPVLTRRPAFRTAGGVITRLHERHQRSLRLHLHARGFRRASSGASTTTVQPTTMQSRPGVRCGPSYSGATAPVWRYVCTTAYCHTDSDCGDGGSCSPSLLAPCGCVRPFPATRGREKMRQRHRLRAPPGSIGCTFNPSVARWGLCDNPVLRRWRVDPKSVREAAGLVREVKERRAAPRHTR